MFPVFPGLAGGEVQFGSVVGGSSGRTLAAPYPSRQGAIPRDDHHLRLDPNVGEGPAGDVEDMEVTQHTQPAVKSVKMPVDSLAEWKHVFHHFCRHSHHAAAHAGGGKDRPGSYRDEGQGFQVGHRRQRLRGLCLREGWPELPGIWTCDFGFRRGCFWTHPVAF